MAEITKEINIKYRWWNHDLESIDAWHVEALAEAALERISEMMADGFTNGDLNDNIRMDDTDPEYGIEYNGWWEVKEAIDATDLLEACQTVFNWLSHPVPGKNPTDEMIMEVLGGAIHKATGE